MEDVMDDVGTSPPVFSAKMDLKGLRVGLLYWEKINTILSYKQLFEYMGFEVTSFLHDEKLPDGIDVVFARGPNGSLAPLAKQLHNLPSPKRPPLIYLLTEPLPNPKIPQWFLYWAGRARSRIERLSYRQMESGNWEIITRFSTSRLKAHRFNYYGDLLWMRSRGILSVLGISSQWNADFLRSKGFDPLVLPICYPAHIPVDFNQERDIPVLWIGKPGTERRRRILQRIRKDLKERGVEMTMIDGIENPYVFGKKRDALLSRTKIVLNIIRQWWDDNSLRYLLAIPKGTMIVTEPTLPHTAFKHGQHLVEAPIEKIADEICYYLAHEEERMQIVQRAYQELTRLSPMDVMHTAFEKAVISAPSRIPSAALPIDDLPYKVNAT
jgi:hypothetical protein